MKKMNRKGFTIVELVIVIAVIAILAAVMIPTFSGIIEKANKSKALQEARNKYTEAYAEDLGDGIVNGYSAAETTVADTNYTVDTSADPADPQYTYDAGNGYTAKFDEGTWAVDTTPAP